ncbi:MAG: GNAT family N-acetyltransferase [Syntrophaceae bacterium]
MDSLIKFCPIMNGDEFAAAELIYRTFRNEIAPSASREGVSNFYEYIQPDSILDRLESNYFMKIAVLIDKVLGVIEIRDCSHISMLVVDDACRGRGIARELVRTAVIFCRKKDPGLQAITANSLPGSVPVYERLGFIKTGPEQEKNGLRLVPMSLDISNLKSQI